MSPPDSNDSCLLTILDTLSGHTFLIDTRAQVSVVPVTAKDHSAPAPSTGPSSLRSANGSHIHVHFSTDSQLILAGRKFTAHLLHAEVDFPLLGADFLHQHHLLVDVRNKCLVDARHWSLLPCSTAPPSGSSRLQVVTAGENFYQSMINEFPELTCPTFNVNSPGCGMEPYIVTSGPPSGCALAGSPRRSYVQLVTSSKP